MNLKFIENMKLDIAHKLISGFGVILAFILINAIFTIGIHMYTRSLQSDEQDEYLPVKAELNELSSLLTESKNLAVSWVFADKQPDSQEKVRLKQIVETDFSKVLNNLKESTANWEQEFSDTLVVIEEKSVEYFEMQKSIMEGLVSFDSYEDPLIIMEAETLVVSDGELPAAEQEMQGYMSGLISKCDVKCEEIRSTIAFWNAVQLVFVIIMSLFVVAMALLVGYVLYNSIVVPLKKGVEFAQKIGSGDLTATIEVQQDDEIGQLSKALQEMVQNVRNIVVTIEQNANELVDSGDAVKQNSLKMSKGASEQAASAEEVSTAIEEMVANIDQNTENAIATEKITGSTAENVTLSAQYSNEAADAMSIISQKITIISDIAFQTNILALNAAVEAVRAGEHGRGFSVVAAEVRKLAERSKQAANEIVELVAKGMKVSQMAGEKAKALVPDIEKTTVLIKEISAASIEQKTGAEQINMAMQNLNVITQENASSSDELTNSSVQLSQLASNLKEAVSFFKLDENAVKEAAAAAAVQAAQATAQAATQQAPVQAAAQPQAAAPAAEKKDVKSAPAQHKQGTVINLGNIADREFDMKDYEKF